MIRNIRARSRLPVLAAQFSTSCLRLSAAPSPSAYEVFDKRAKRIQRDRASSNADLSRQVNYLRHEVATRMVERLAFISRQFNHVLDLGSGSGSLEQVLCDPQTPDSEIVRSRLGEITMLDSSKKTLYRDSDSDIFPFNKLLNINRIVADEETLSDIETGAPAVSAESFDAVISSMSMHWINDLPGILNRVNEILVPDGMFMASILGGDSLFELRTSLQLAELERFDRVSPRLSPLVDVKDVGGLLQRAHFNLLTVDVDDIIVSYPDMFALLDDIRAMGDSNAVLTRQSFIPRDILLSANEIYKSLHGSMEEDPYNPTGEKIMAIPATFRIIFLIGWKNSPNQPKPLERGTATVNLKEALPQFQNGSEGKISNSDDAGLNKK